MNRLKEVMPEAIREHLEINPEEYDALRKPSDPATLTEWADLRLPHLYHDQSLVTLTKWIDDPVRGSAIANLTWRLIDMESSISLLTSDRPDFVHGDTDAPDMLVMIPVGPRQLFYAFRHPGTERAILSRGHQKLAKAVNHTVVAQARLWVYAQDAMNQKLIEKRFNPKEAYP